MEPKNTTGSTQIFMNACKTGKMGVFKQLLIKGEFDVNRPVSIEEQDSKGDKVLVLPISYAIYNCNKVEKIIELLVEYGVNLDALNCKTANTPVGTPLHDAVSCQNLIIVRHLLKYGADITSINIDRQTPWDLAISEKYWNAKIIREFLTSDARLLPTKSKIDWARKKYFDLGRALVKANQEELKSLLEVNEYEDFKILNYPHPIILAARLKCHTDFEFMFEKLIIDIGKIFFSLLVIENYEFIEACITKHPEVLKMRNEDNQSALFFACFLMNIDLALYFERKTEYDKDWEHRRNFGNYILLFEKILNKPSEEREEWLPIVNFMVRHHYIGPLENWLKSRTIQSDCEFYTLLLEHGADPRDKSSKTLIPHECCPLDKCKVLEHFKKLNLIAPDYFDGINMKNWPPIYNAKKRWNKLKFKNVDKYKCELDTLKAKRIEDSKLTLYTFLFISVEEAEFYWQHRGLSRIYRSCRLDFSKRYPYYGFALNFQLRRKILQGSLLPLD